MASDFQKYLLEQRAVLDNDGGKLLNEDNDVRPVSSKISSNLVTVKS